MRPLLLHWHSRPVTLVKTNHDGDLLLTSGKDGVCCLGYVATGERIGTYDGHNGAIYACDITMDSKYVVTASADGFVAVWEALTGEQLVMMKHGGIVKFAEWNQKPFAQNLLVTCNDQFRGALDNNPARICVWEYDEEDRELNQILAIADLPMKASKVKWGAADETLVSIHDEGTVFIWAFPSGDRVHSFEAHKLPVTDLCFMENRMLMMTTSRDCSIKLWDTTTKSDKPEPVKTFGGESRPFNTCSISPLYAADKERKKYHMIAGGGQNAADVTTTGAKEGMFEAVLYHLVSEEELGTVTGHFGPMNSVTFFADGTGFVTGGEDGYIRIHHFDPDYFQPKRWD